MEHQFYRDRLSAYFDHELKHEEHAIVHEHIESCDECQKELLELEKLENLIADKTTLSDNDYWEQSAQKIESALEPNKKTEVIEIPKKSKGLWWKLTGVAASLVLVSLIAFEEKENDFVLPNDKNTDVVDKIIESDNEALLLNSDDTVSLEKVITTIPVETESQDKLKQEIPLTIKESSAKPLQIQSPQKSESLKKEVETRAESPTVSRSESIRNLGKSKAVSEEAILDAVDLSETISAEAKAVEIQDKYTTSNNLSATSKTQSMTVQDAKEKRIEKTLEVNSEDVITEAEQKNEKIKKTEVDLQRSKPVVNESFGIVAQAPKIATDNVENIKIFQENISESSQIAYWQRKVSEYSTQLQNKKSKKAVRYLKSSKADNSEKKNSNLPVDKNFIYKELFKSYYNIAILTTDSTQEQEAVSILKIYADSLTKSYSSSALHYYQLYKNEKMKQKSKKD